jgi:hypothetical protein
VGPPHCGERAQPLAPSPHFLCSLANEISTIAYVCLCNYEHIEWTLCYGSRMQPSVSEFDALKLKSEIQWLVEARRSCYDTGVQKQIDIWIKDRQRSLRKSSLRVAKKTSK